MKILHTSDWHLGKRLNQNERITEHSLFLKWLIETIISQKINVLIIAGDIFDTGNPPNTALKQYYDFLWRVKDAGCSDIIIIGGNHDSVTTLNAPKDLLYHLNIHVIGGIPEIPEEQIIPIKDTSNNIQLVICAVPFLRDKDIRISIAGETSEERESRIKEGIINHYQSLIPYIKEYKNRNIPVITTGHLFAAGSQASRDSEKEIHIGNLGQIAGSQFPEEFDYIALGHLHRPQKVNQMDHIRYSGSPVALSFSENEDKKIVLVISFEQGKSQQIEEIAVPEYRRLIRIKDTLEKVKEKLVSITTNDDQLPAWVEVQVETNQFIYDLIEQLNTLVEDNPKIGQLFIKQIRVYPHTSIEERVEEHFTLGDLDPLSVFKRKCEIEFPEGEFEDLITTFEEALVLINQNITGE